MSANYEMRPRPHSTGDSSQSSWGVQSGPPPRISPQKSLTKHARVIAPNDRRRVRKQRRERARAPRTTDGRLQKVRGRGAHAAKHLPHQWGEDRGRGGGGEARRVLAHLARLAPHRRHSKGRPGDDIREDLVGENRRDGDVAPDHPPVCTRTALLSGRSVSVPALKSADDASTTTSRHCGSARSAPAVRATSALWRDVAFEMHEAALHAAWKWTPYASTAAPHAHWRATAVRATGGTPSQRRVAIRMVHPPMAPAGRPGAGNADSLRPAPTPWQAASRARSALSGSEARSRFSAERCTGPARSRWDGARAPPSSRAQLSRVPPATRSRPVAAIWASAGGARRSGAVEGVRAPRRTRRSRP